MEILTQLPWLLGSVIGGAFAYVWGYRAGQRSNRAMADRVLANINRLMVPVWCSECGDRIERDARLCQPCFARGLPE